MKTFPAAVRLAFFATFCLALCAVFGQGNAWADQDLSQYGREWESIKNEWNAEQARHNERIAEIQKQYPEGPRRNAAIEAENARHLSKSQDLAARRHAIHEKVMTEASRRVADTGSQAGKEMRPTTGTKPGETGHRGMAGDLDAGAGGHVADKVDDVLRDMGIKVEKKSTASTVEYGDGFNLTVNKEGKLGRAGSGAFQTQVGVDARNPETYVSEGMAKDQPGRKAVEVQDHIKKGKEALNAPPEQVAKDPRLQHEMAKSTKKVLGTETVSDAELQKILKETGINETPQEFKERIERIKEGRAKPGDVTPENARKLQEASRRIAETATETSGRIAETEMKTTRERIADLERKGTPEAKAEARKLREQLVDSKVRVEETRAANKEKVGGTSDVDGPGRVADADGPGRGPKDVDGPGRVADADGPGRGPKDVDGPGGVADADGPGRGPKDVDGPGGKGRAPPQTPGTMQQVTKVVGAYMEGVMILEQAEKLRDGIKAGDTTKIVEGIAGEDLAKRTETQGAKDYASAMDDLDKAKKGEVLTAELTKLKRMGATSQEIADYQKAKEAGDYGKARQIAHEVRDRGGKDTKPVEGLEGAPPEDGGWDLKDQLKEGANQAGSYLAWAANVISGGFVGKRQQSTSDADEMVGIADDLDKKTKEQIRQSMINKLAGTGEMSVSEARELVDKLEKGDREEFNRVVGELREKGAFEKQKGKHGLTPDTGVDIPETDFAQEAKDTASGLKHTLVDRPAEIINSIVEDSLEATVGSEKYASERNAAERTEEFKDQYQRKYEGLIREGATPEQAKQALDGPMGSVNRLLKDLREQREKDKSKDMLGERDKERVKGQDKLAKGAGDKAPRTESDRITRDIFGPKDPRLSGKQDFAQVVERKPYDGPVNDAGQRVDPTRYDEGNMVITADGTEWQKRDAQWVKTGRNYGPYDPKGRLKDAEPTSSRVGHEHSDHESSGSGAGLEGFASERGERVGNHTKGSYGLMSGQRGVADASSSSEQAEKESQNVLNSAASDAQATGVKSAAATAAGDRENSWGKAVADGVQQSIEKGLTTAGETLGSRSADKVSSQVFKPPKTEKAGSSGGASGDENEKSGGAQPPSEKGGGPRRGGQGSGSPPPGGGQKGAKATPPSDKPGTGATTGIHHCPKCGRTDLVQKVHDLPNVRVTEWRCPACNVVGRMGPPPAGLGQSSGAGTGTQPSQNCQTCGQPMTPIVIPADPNDAVGYRWACNACGRKDGQAVAQTPPPSRPPPPPPEPPPPAKKTRRGCCVCKAPVTYVATHYLYGDVYECANGHSIKGRDLVTVEE